MAYNSANIIEHLSRGAKNFGKAFGDVFYSKHAPENVKVSIPELVNSQEVPLYTKGNAPMYAGYHPVTGEGGLYGINETIPKGYKVSPVMPESGKLPDVLDATQGSIIGLSQDPYNVNAGRATLLNTIGEESVNGTGLAKVNHPTEVPAIAKALATEEKQAEQIAPAVMLSNNAEGNIPYAPGIEDAAMESALSIKHTPEVGFKAPQGAEFEKDIIHNAKIDMINRFKEEHPDIEPEKIDYAIRNIIDTEHKSTDKLTDKVDLQSKYGISNDYSKLAYSNIDGILNSNTFSDKTKAIASHFADLIPDNFERHSIEAVGKEASALTPFNDHLFKEILKVDRAIKKAEPGSIQEKWALKKMTKLMKQETTRQYQTALSNAVEPINQGAIDKSAMKSLKNVLKGINPEEDISKAMENVKAFKEKFYDDNTFAPNKTQEELLIKLADRYPLMHGSVDNQLTSLVANRLSDEEAKDLFGRFANYKAGENDAKIGAVPLEDQKYIPGAVSKGGHTKRIGNTIASPLFARTYELLQGVLHHPSNIDELGSNFFDKKHLTESELKSTMSPLAHDNHLRELYVKYGGEAAAQNLRDFDELRLNPNEFTSPDAFYGAMATPGSDVDKFHRMAERLESSLQAAADRPILDALSKSGDPEIERLLNKLYTNPTNKVAASTSDIGSFLLSNPRIAGVVEELLTRDKPNTELLDAIGQSKGTLSKYAETDFNEYAVNVARAMQTRSNVKALPTVLALKEFGRKMMEGNERVANKEDQDRLFATLGDRDARKFITAAMRAGDMNSLGTYWNTVPTPEQFNLRSLAVGDSLANVHMVNSSNVPEIMDRFTGTEMSTQMMPGDAFSLTGEKVLNRSAHPLLEEAGERSVANETLYGRDPNLGGIAQLAQSPNHRAIEWSPEHIGTFRERGIRLFADRVNGSPLDIEGKGVPKAIMGKTYTKGSENLYDLPYRLAGLTPNSSGLERAVRGIAIDQISNIDRVLSTEKGKVIAVAKIAENLMQENDGLSIEEASAQAQGIMDNIHSLAYSIEPGLASAERGNFGEFNPLYAAVQRTAPGSKSLDYIGKVLARVGELGDELTPAQAEKAVSTLFKTLNSDLLTPVMRDLGFEDSSHFTREALQASPMKSDYSRGDIQKIFSDSEHLRRWLSVANYVEDRIATTKIKPATKKISSRLNIGLGPELKANQVSLPFKTAKDLMYKALDHSPKDVKAEFLAEFKAADSKKATRMLNDLFASDALEVIREPKWLSHNSQLEIVVRKPDIADDNRLRIPAARSPYSNADFDGDTLSFAVFGREFDLDPKGVIPTQSVDASVEESVKPVESKDYAITPTGEVIGHLYRTLASRESNIPVTETGKAIRNYLEEEAATRENPLVKAESGFPVLGEHQIGQQLRQHATNVHYMNDPIRSQRLQQFADYYSGTSNHKPQAMKNYKVSDIAVGLNPYVSDQQSKLTNEVVDALASADKNLPDELKEQYTKLLADELFSEIQNPSSSVVHKPSTPVSDRASSKRAIAYHRVYENLPVEDLAAVGYEGLNNLLKTEAPKVQRDIIDAIRNHITTKSPAFIDLSKQVLGEINDAMGAALSTKGHTAAAGAGGVPFQGIQRYVHAAKVKDTIDRPEDLLETAAALIQSPGKRVEYYADPQKNIAEIAQLADILSNNGKELVLSKEPPEVKEKGVPTAYTNWHRILVNTQREHAGLDKTYEDIEKQKGSSILTRNPIARIYGRKNTMAYLTPDQERIAKALGTFSRPIALHFPQTRENNAAMYTASGQKVAVPDLAPFNDAAYEAYIEGNPEWQEIARKAENARRSSLGSKFKGSSRH
jgi:hypothetical protein